MKRSHWICQWAFLLALNGFLGPASAAVAPAEKSASTTALLESFRTPPRACTQVPFWFWNGPLDPSEFRRQLRQMADKGVYAALPHPRFGMDRREYLEEPFWRAMAETLDEAQKLGMEIWLYDEYNWPSGGAGGRVTLGHPELYPRGLDYTRLTVSGPRQFSFPGPTNLEPRMEVFEKYIRAFSRKAGETPQAWSQWGEIGPDGGTLAGQIPPGEWELLVFYQSLGRNPSPLDEGSNSMTDYLSEKPLRRFLELTHEEYYRRFRNYFGSVIRAAFSDESSTTAPAPFPWTQDFAAELERRQGIGLTDLPQLVEGQDRRAMTARLAYWQTVADLYQQRHLKNYADWCQAHHLKFTGHVFEEDIASYAHAPQLMDLLRPMDRPGFDALGARCPPHGAKVPISVAHLENRDEAMCESMGLAGGWNCTLAMLREGYNTLGWLGASRFVPHAFFQTVDNPRVECPPSFFFQNPYWKYYRRIADLTGRLSLFNRLGTHVAPCAVYYPIESLWADSPGGKGNKVLPWQHRSVGNQRASETIQAFNQILDGLMEARWDLDVVDDRALGQARVAEVQGSPRLRIGPEDFRVLVVPPVSAIGESALRTIDAFIQKGGTVLWLDRLPELTWPARENEPATTLTRWFPQGTPQPSNDAKPAKGRPVLLTGGGARLAQWLDQNLVQEIAVHGQLAALKVTHRRSGDTDAFLLFNDSDQFMEGEAALGPKGQCALVDVDTGRAWAGQLSSFGLRVSLRPRQSAVALFGLDSPGLAAWPPNRPTGQPQDLSADWEAQVAANALDDNWSPELKDAEVEVPVFRSRKRDFQKWPGWEQPGYDDRDWTTVHAVRGGALSTEASPILFRTTLPPGTRSILLPIPVTGEYALWVNGQLLAKQLGSAGTGTNEISLAGIVKGTGDVLALETISHSGPAGLEAPLKVRCSSTLMDHLRSWKDLGLGYYTGRMCYRKSFTLEDRPSRLWLDLGNVEHYAEIYLNGKLVETLLWPPYELEISAQCRPGINELALVVANSVANRFAWDVWGTRGTAKPEPSGLIGPVRLWRE